MKTLTKSIALVAVTTLFATAFSTAHLKQHHTATDTMVETHVPQVVILGQRMTALEKVQYDLSQDQQTVRESDSEAQPIKLKAVHIAVK